MTAALNLPDKQDWTVDDLASLPKDLRYELIDGRLILPSPTAIHQDIGVEILLALRVGCPPDLMPVVDLSLAVNCRNEPRPDVVVIRPDHANISPVPVDDAVLAVEVISPGSHFRDMYAKAKVYAAARVAHYWVIDPLFEDGIVLTAFQPGDTGEYEIVASTNKVFTTDVPFGVSIDLPALTERRRALLERARPQD
ncbi:Uma2 family endonuclease [Krasilnikovia sp. M28-CT-15]|uniref:Uma2 family endonuclease n=1 Tax=Krasilnikovia sp. M28-CT-15 TaxID=3373540 RepID=UPI0038772459